MQFLKSTILLLLALAINGAAIQSGGYLRRSETSPQSKEEDFFFEDKAYWSRVLQDTNMSAASPPLTPPAVPPPAPTLAQNPMGQPNPPPTTLAVPPPAPTPAQNPMGQPNPPPTTPAVPPPAPTSAQNPMGQPNPPPTTTTVPPPAPTPAQNPEGPPLPDLCNGVCTASGQTCVTAFCCCNQQGCRETVDGSGVLLSLCN